jgi:hypothetical protein
MRKVKLGLQKEVSRIFTGIAVPGKKSPDPSGVAQAKTNAAGSQIPNHPAGQAQPAHPVANTPLVEPPPAVTTSQVVPPVPIAAPKTIASPSRPASEPPHPFTIPEPPQSKTPVPKSPVYERPQAHSQLYEPPARKQGVYEPPPAPSVQSSAKHQKVEIISSVPGWQTSVLKILRPLTDKFLAPKPGVSPVRQKATLALIAVLPLFFIFMITKVFIVPAKAGAKSAKTTVAAAVNNQINWQLPSPLPDNFRDPMVLGDSGRNQQGQAGPVVKGIVYSDDNPCAVVGDRIVSAGDTVNGATVVKINPGSVEFAAGDKKWSQEVER